MGIIKGGSPETSSISETPRGLTRDGTYKRGDLLQRGTNTKYEVTRLFKIALWVFCLIFQTQNTIL